MASEVQEEPFRQGSGLVASRGDLFTAGGMVLLWLFFVYPWVISPWIYGVDSVNRILHIDETVVVLLGNPWLPLLQLIMQGVHLISDAPQAYKIAMTIISASGMFLFFLVVCALLGRWCAVLSCTSFFLFPQWAWMATQPYMEPLLLLTVSGAVYAHLHGLNRLSAVLVVAATFSRPEISLAAPFVLIGHYCFYGSWRRTARLAMLWAPVAIYYVTLRFWLPDFSVRADFNWQTSRYLFETMTYGFGHAVFYQLLAVLAFLGAVFGCVKESDPRRRKGLQIIFTGLMLFYAFYVLVVPALHSIVPSSRFSLYVILPCFVYASVSLDYMRRQRADKMTMVLLVLVTALLTLQYSRRRVLVPDSYRLAGEISRRARRSGFDTPGTIYACVLDKRRLSAPDLDGMYKRGLFLHLRFAGWRVEYIPCGARDLKWREVIAENSAPLIRVYDLKGVKSDYLQELTGACRYHDKIRHGRRIMGSVCM